MIYLVFSVMRHFSLFFPFWPTYGVMFRRTLKRQIQHNKYPFLMNRNMMFLLCLKRDPHAFLFLLINAGVFYQPIIYVIYSFLLFKCFFLCLRYESSFLFDSKQYKPIADNANDHYWDSKPKGQRTILQKQADTFTSKSSRHYLLVKISR